MFALHFLLGSVHCVVVMGYELRSSYFLIVWQQLLEEFLRSLVVMFIVRGVQILKKGLIFH